MGSVCPRCRREPTRADGICEAHGLYAVPPAEVANLERAPLLGVVVEGRYALVGHIGVGGMGAVYRAHQLVIDRDVAFKILHSAAASGEVARARFRREAQVIAGLQSDHTVRVFDFGEVTRGGLAGTLYMVMDLVEGFSLSERLRGGPLLVEEVGLVLAHVANSVDEAHQKGIVHRDLKPSNILLTEHQGQRRAKVIDFGIARTEDSDHTHQGNALGTPAYMAPELWPSDVDVAIDGRVDVYAMGVVLYQMLTGRKPFPGRDMLALADAHRNRVPPPLASDDAQLAMFNPVIARSMAKRPEDRYATLGAMAADFERYRVAAVARFGPTDTFTWTHPPMIPAGLVEPSGSSQILQGALEAETLAEPVPGRGLGRGFGRGSGQWWPAVALVAVGVSIGLTILMQTRGEGEGARGVGAVVAPGDEVVMRAAGGDGTRARGGGQGVGPRVGLGVEPIAAAEDAPAAEGRAAELGAGAAVEGASAGMGAAAIEGAPADSAERPAEIPAQGTAERNAEQAAERTAAPAAERAPAPKTTAPKTTAPKTTAPKTTAPKPAATAERVAEPARTARPAAGGSNIGRDIERALAACACSDARRFLDRAAQPGAGLSDRDVRAFGRRITRCRRPDLGEECTGF